MPDQPEPTDQPENEPSDEPTQEPTPEPDNQPDEPTPTPEPDGDQPNDPPGKRRTLWWMLILIMALLARAALWVKRRLRLNDPGYRAAKAADEREKALVWYPAVSDAADAARIVARRAAKRRYRLQGAPSSRRKRRAILRCLPS